MTRTTSTLTVALFASALAVAADLPVRQVVLYKHGVGYFERAGQLGPGESARLDFKAAEMNDVLKSLTIEEKGGGKITGLRYDSSEPLAQRLAEFPFQLGSQQPLSAVLDQLKGAGVELQLGTQTVAGAIVGGRLVPGDEKRQQQEQVTLLFDSGPQPTLEGWAIVDNTTGEDWTNVQLALVSGRPISFISPLYEPRYIQRQVAELPEDRAQRPVIHEGDLEEAKDAPAQKAR